MGFNKASNPKEISVVVTHPMHPSDEYVFHFPKQLPQSALDAESAFLGSDTVERAKDARLALVNVVAEMVSRAPEGFDDFPSETAANDLPLRMRRYFDDTEEPELEQILTGAWRAYRAAATPSAYLKSVQDRGAGSGESSNVPAKASSGE